MLAWPTVRTPLGSFAILSINNYLYIGVDLFFVLSGFCLAWPYVSDSSRPFVWGRYLKRRFWRIYPPYFIVFVALLIVGYAFDRVDDGTGGKVSQLSVSQLLLGLALQKTFLNGAFWTLTLELRWYLVFPFAVMLSKRFSVLPALLVSIVICIVTPSGSTAIGKLLVYLPEFLAGVWAAEILARPSKPLHSWMRRIAVPAFVVMLSIGFWKMPGSTGAGRVGYPEALIAGGLFFFLVLHLVHIRFPVPIWLGWLRTVGISSYTLYLVHGPIIQTVAGLVPTAAWSPIGKVAFWYGAVVPFTAALAFGVYHVLEKPFLNTFSTRKQSPLAVAQHAAP